MGPGRHALALVAASLLLASHVRAVPPVDCGERMLGVLTSPEGHRRTVRIAGTMEYPGFVLRGRFRCRDGRNASCPVPSASAFGLTQGVYPPPTTGYRISLSHGSGDAYRLLCTLEGTAPFLFGLYIPALEGTYTCDVDGLIESGTFQLVGVHMGRCSGPR